MLSIEQLLMTVFLGLLIRNQRVVHIPPGALEKLQTQTLGVYPFYKESYDYNNAFIQFGPVQIAEQKGGFADCRMQPVAKVENCQQVLEGLSNLLFTCHRPSSKLGLPPFSTQSPGRVPHLLQQFKTTLPKYLLSFKWVKRRKCLNVYLGGQVVYGLCN